MPVCRECEYNILVLGKKRYVRDGEVISIDLYGEGEGEAEPSRKGVG